MDRHTHSPEGRWIPTGGRATADGHEAPAGAVRSPAEALPWLPLWLAPAAFVLAYILVVKAFYPGVARWTDFLYGEVGMALLLVLVSILFSGIWFGVSYLASRTIGVAVPLATLYVLTHLPLLRKHVVLSPPPRAETLRERLGRFAILFGVALAFELLYILVALQRGALSPHLTVARPGSFFGYELAGGVLLGLLLAPAGAYLASRYRLRIVDGLEFPLLWLTILLLAAGGATALLLVVLPRVATDTGVFFASVLLYAPSAWYLALGFLAAETPTRAAFTSRAMRARGPYLHFGRLEVIESESSTRVEV